MKIAIGADHGGFELKQKLVEHLRGKGHDVRDLGTDSTQAVDYPVFARRVAEAVAGGQAERGIMIDGAGIGSSMVANKVAGVRAAMAYDVSSARNGREHNDANLLTLGAGLIGAALATQIVDVFLTTDCTEPRHQRRVAMINDTAASAPAAAGGGVSLSGLSDTDMARVLQRLEGMVGGARIGGGQGGGVQDGGGRHGGGWHGGPCVGTCPDTARRFIELGARGFSACPDSTGRIPDELARYIDHTILKPDATPGMIDKVIAEAREFSFRSVCVNPCWVKRVADGLRGTRVLTCSVVGFPLGTNTPDIKGMESRKAIRDGGAVSKVILETALLTNEEKVRACELSRKARANFVKTSTGFASGGATAEDVALMASVVRGAGMEVKASGGIRSFDDARRMIEAGATRLGASASIAIVQEAQKTVKA